MGLALPYAGPVFLVNDYQTQDLGLHLTWSTCNAELLYENDQLKYSGTLQALKTSGVIGGLLKSLLTRAEVGAQVYYIIQAIAECLFEHFPVAG